MHRSRDIQEGIFEPWDWVYFQALPKWAWAEICQKLVQTPLFMFTQMNLSFEKFEDKNFTKKPIWRGSGSVPNPSTTRSRIKNSGCTPERYIH
jgi:hypothetical protein